MSAAPFDLSGRTALVTGCRRGIGRAAAVALAQAGADIVGVSASLEPRSEVAAAVEARGRSFRALPLRLRRSRSACTTSSPRCAATDARDRHPRQQRRHDRARPGSRARRRALGSRARGEPDCAVRARARARPRHGRARERQDRVRRLAALVPGRHQRAGLHGEQVGRRRPDEGARERVGRARRQRQRRRARLRRAPTTRRRCRTTRTRYEQILARIPAGRWADAGGHRRRHRLPGSPAADYVHGVVLPVDGGWLAR